MVSTKLTTTGKSLLVSFFNSALTLLIFVCILVVRLPIHAQTPPVRPPGIVLVNAASMAELTSVAPGSLVTIFGTFKTQNNAALSATTTPLPATLGGISVKLDTTACQLTYVSPTQINVYLPETIKSLSSFQSYPFTVTDAAAQTFTRQIEVTSSTPGIFTVQSNGQGTAVGQITNGANALSNIYNPDGSPKDLEITTDGKQNYLTLYGTGFRFASTTTPNDANGVAEAFQVTIQGIAADLTFVSAQGQYAGLDQINIKLPPQAAGLGVVKLRIGGSGFFYTDLTNPVTIKMGGAPPPIAAKAVPEGQLPFDATGELTRSSQVMKSASGNVYFFDAWRYKATQKGLSLTFRSTVYAPLVLIYKVGADKSLQFVAASGNTYDNLFGGLIVIGGTRSSPSLLVTALPEVGEYLIFVTSTDSYPEAIGQYQFTLNTKVTELNTSNLPLTQQAKFDSTDLTTGNGTPLDAYWWTGNKGDKLEFEATSTEFRPPLWVVKADGTTITSTITTGDTSAGTTRLTTTLPETGNYMLVATSGSPYKMGPYSLTMRRVTTFTGNEVEAENATSQATLIERQKQIERLGARRIVILNEPKPE